MLYRVSECLSGVSMAQWQGIYDEAKREYLDYTNNSKSFLVGCNYIIMGRETEHMMKADGYCIK